MGHPLIGLGAEGGLVGFDEVADALGVGLAVAVAGDGVGAAGGLDANVGPDHAGGDVHGGDLGDGDALFIVAEPARLHAADPLRTDDELGREEEVALRPAAGGEGFGLGSGWGCGHGVMVRRESGVSMDSNWLGNWGTSRLS